MRVNMYSMISQPKYFWIVRRVPGSAKEAGERKRSEKYILCSISHKRYFQRLFSSSFSRAQTLKSTMLSGIWPKFSFFIATLRFIASTHGGRAKEGEAGAGMKCQKAEPLADKACVCMAYLKIFQFHSLQTTHKCVMYKVFLIFGWMSFPLLSIIALWRRRKAKLKRTDCRLDVRF